MVTDEPPVRLPRLFKEDKAAEALDVSTDTLRRERRRGEIGFILIGGRPHYTENQLNDYLARKTVPPCSNNTESAITGCPSGETQNSGVARGSIRRRDRRAAHLSALTTLRPPGRGSPNGSH